jgi:hypothetical protein
MIKLGFLDVKCPHLFSEKRTPIILIGVDFTWAKMENIWGQQSKGMNEWEK